jgi:CsoR family transcriptional regulator, copper-sensing transcriptional repressor
MLPHPGWGGAGWAVTLGPVHPEVCARRKGTVMSEESTAKKRAALNRLKTVRGHLDGIVRMLESDAYCVDVMKQISAVQAALERTNRVMLHNHLETCFSEAVIAGKGEAAIAELVDALKFSPALTGPDTCLNGT